MPRKISQMYNKSRKERYLEECKYAYSTTTTIKMFFSTASVVEEYYNQDLCEFIQPQVIDLLKKISSRSRQTLTNMCVFFSDYHKWCFEQGFILNEISPYDISVTKIIIENVIPKELLNNKYFGNLEMVEYVENIFDPTNKYIAYCIYLGIKGDELRELIYTRPEDLDRENKTMKLITGRVVDVDDFFIELLDDANSATYYKKKVDVLEGGNHATEYVPSEYVLKKAGGGDPQPINRNTLAVRFAIMRKESGNRFFSVPAMYKNGLIDYITKRHQEINPDLTIKEILFNKIDNKLYEHDVATTQYILDFGSKMDARALRMELRNYIDCYEE